MILTDNEQSIIIKALDTQGEHIHPTLTSWSLITGAPGSGKTTLVNFMNSKGWRTLSDPGRAEYEHQIEQGNPPETARRNYAQFQQLVLKRFLLNIKTIDTNLPAIFDYGIAESLAFMKITGTPWCEEIIKAAVKIKFSNVFILDMVPLAESNNDKIRSETALERRTLKNLISEIYICLGYKPMHVPLMSTQERFEWVRRCIDSSQF